MLPTRSYTGYSWCKTFKDITWCRRRFSVKRTGWLMTGQKMLFYNTTRQARVPAAIAPVDASNCYDRIAHTMVSLVFQAFGVPITAIKTMLGAIENMKFFLCTGFGDLKSLAGGGIRTKTQGLTQGNGASPAVWAVITICILGAHRKKGARGQILLSNHQTTTTSAGHLICRWHQSPPYGSDKGWNGRRGARGN